MKLSAIAPIALAGSTAAKVYSRCDAAYALRHTCGFSEPNIPDWTCLVANESGYNTGAVGGPNYDGSYDYGFFQINDYYWCYATSPSSATKYNDCNINCSKLIDSNISDDCKCATKIWQRHGYSAWYGWINGCKNRDVSSYVSGCKY